MKRNRCCKPGIRWVLYAAAIAATFAAGALWRGGGRPPADAPAADGPSGDPAARATLYYCSMHPQIRSPDPNDKCPICFMDLIPLPDDDDDDEAEAGPPRLRLNARAAALLDIRTWPVERRPVTIDVGLFGKVDFDESRLYTIPARTDAYVERLWVNTPWQPVARGDTLAEFYSPAAVTAMRELLVAGGDATVEAARARLRRMGVAEAQIAEIERTGTAPRTFRVESPVKGMALPAETRTGDYLREGAVLTHIADVSRVWVHLEAYERDLPWLAAGQKAHVTVAGLPGITFKGAVSLVYPVVDSRMRTARLRIEADNPDSLLKPGMYVSAVVHALYPPVAGSMDNSKIEDQKSDLPLVIPATAPLITGQRAVVYVRVPEGDRPTFEPRHVVLGPRAGEVFVVKDGLAEGDLVVVHGQFKIDSELQIRGRPSMMSPEESSPAGPAPDRAAGLQTHCPVMGGPINEEYFIDVEGYRVYVCCPGCDQAVLEEPPRYIAQMRAEGVEPYRLQTHCPVMGGEIQRDFFHDHEGWRIYVCCPACLDEVRERAGEILAEQRKKGIVFERAGE